MHYEVHPRDRIIALVVCSRAKEKENPGDSYTESEVSLWHYCGRLYEACGILQNEHDRTVEWIACCMVGLHKSMHCQGAWESQGPTMYTALHETYSLCFPAQAQTCCRASLELLGHPVPARQWLSGKTISWPLLTHFRMSPLLLSTAQKQTFGLLTPPSPTNLHYYCGSISQLFFFYSCADFCINPSKSLDHVGSSRTLSLIPNALANNTIGSISEFFYFLSSHLHSCFLLPRLVKEIECIKGFVSFTK